MLEALDFVALWYGRFVFGIVGLAAILFVLFVLWSLFVDWVSS